jgi:hypothetical protein
MELECRPTLDNLGYSEDALNAWLSMPGLRRPGWKMPVWRFPQLQEALCLAIADPWWSPLPVHCTRILRIALCDLVGGRSRPRNQRLDIAIYLSEGQHPVLLVLSRNAPRTFN